MAFAPTTAEHIVGAVDAVVAAGTPAGKTDVAAFLDIPEAHAEAALDLATELGFLSAAGPMYLIASPLARFLTTPNDERKAAALRVALESYNVFDTFRARLVATASVDVAAQQCKALHGLTPHREEVKNTLISLGTFSHALISDGGGRYRLGDKSFDNILQTLANACADAAAAEQRIRDQMGPDAAAVVSRAEVLSPLADALLRAREGDSRGAVVAAANGIESYLVEVGVRLAVALAGATGINAKLERFATANAIPKKVIAVGKFLGTVRNAADHGIDPDTGGSWTIRPSTGYEYVFVACSFVASVTKHESGGPKEI